MAEIIDSWKVFDIALTSAPPATPPTTPPTTQPGASVRNLAPGDYKIVVTKSQYDPFTATIRVSSSGRVQCLTGYCNSSHIPRVSIDNNAVRVHLRKVSDTSSTGVDTPGGSPGVSTGIPVGTPPSGGTGGMCGWIRSIGGWKEITWDHVLAAKYTYIGEAGYNAGFSPIEWDDVLTLKYYYIDQVTGNPSTGNASKHGCGFT